MKKITLLGLVLIATSALFAQTPSYTWDGAQPVQVWDLVTPNWMDDNFPIPLPTSFVDASIVNFNDAATHVGNDTIKVTTAGNTTPGFHLLGMNINAAKTYVLNQTTTADSLSGSGTLIKDGSGDFIMDIKNSMTGGTIIKNGRLQMEKQTTANIFGPSITFVGNGIANFATTTSSLYPAITVPVTINAGVTATVELSRYSYWSSPVSGTGDLIISTGGERCMLGNNKAGGVKVDWSKFTGNVTVQSHKLTGITPGYYGVLLPSTKTYDYTNLNTVDSMFWKRKVTLQHAGGLAGCSGVRCWGIGELQAANDSCFLTGYGAGASSTPSVYYMIGASNTDVVFPGTIIDAGGKGYNNVGIIKVGTGKYTFTSTKSITTASVGVEVKAGSLLVNIPVTSTTTAFGRVKSTSLWIRGGATGGGNGRITGAVTVDSLGTLVVGYNGIGQLVLGDTLTGTIKSPLTVKHGGQVILKVTSKTSFDNISTNSTAIFNGGTILVQPTANLSLHNGDSLIVLTTKTRTAVDSFTVRTQNFPTGTSITYSKDTIAGSGYKITLIVHTATAVISPSDNSKISVYPNPTRGEVNFSSSDAEISEIEIMNVQGQMILRRTINSTTANINLSNYAAGVYYTKIITSKGTKIQKLLLQ
jgi:autotransporter-associated beta strand protein